MVSVRARRTAVAYATGRGLSQRRACTLLTVARSALGYCSRKTEKDAPVLGRMSELARQYPRYGYRRIRIFLGRDGHLMSASRAYRLWQAARLQVPRRRPRKRIATGRLRPNAPTGANQVWSYDFVFDWCVNGQKLKCLTVTDEWTKEGLAIEVDVRIRSARVIEAAGAARLRARHAALSALGQWPGVRISGAAQVDRRPGHRDSVDRSRQALAEWDGGELQLQVPRRVPEPGVVPLAGRGHGGDRDLAPALQRGAAAFEPGLPDAGLWRKRGNSIFKLGAGR